MPVGHNHRKPHRTTDNGEEKFCFICNEWRSVTLFCKATRSWDKLSNKCKPCSILYNKANQERIREYNATHKAQYQQWCEANREELNRKARIRNRQWYRDNREDILRTKTEWRNKNKDKINARIRQQRIDDPSLRIKDCLYRRVGEWLKGSTKSANTQELLGCSFQQFKEWLESKFVEGMSWENQGSEWHVDHEVPCAAFDLSDPVQHRICFHYSNMQPLWKEDNLAKGCKVSDIAVETLKNRLTPEVLERVQKLHALESEKEEAQAFRQF